MSRQRQKKQRPPQPETPRPDFEATLLRPINEAQSRLMSYILDLKPLVFVLGPAGTGKTFLATAMAADALAAGDIERIYITRPAVEAGESLGFLPGTIEEKFEPYLAPVKDVLFERLGVKKTESFMKMGIIKAVPLNFMRGHTLKNCWVVADEMQNSTPGEMLMLLTRLGENCKAIVSGDIYQKDNSGWSGLEDGVTRMRGSQYVALHEFTEDDIVRSGLAKEVVLRYRNKT